MTALPALTERASGASRVSEPRSPRSAGALPASSSSAATSAAAASPPPAVATSRSEPSPARAQTPPVVSLVSRRAASSARCVDGSPAGATASQSARASASSTARRRWARAAASASATRVAKTVNATSAAAASARSRSANSNCRTPSASPRARSTTESTAPAPAPPASAAEPSPPVTMASSCRSASSASASSGPCRSGSASRAPKPASTCRPSSSTACSSALSARHAPLASRAATRATAAPSLVAESASPAMSSSSGRPVSTPEPARDRASAACAATCRSSWRSDSLNGSGPRAQDLEHAHRAARTADRQGQGGRRPAALQAARDRRLERRVEIGLAPAHGLLEAAVDRRARARQLGLQRRRVDVHRARDEHAASGVEDAHEHRIGARELGRHARQQRQRARIVALARGGGRLIERRELRRQAARADRGVGRLERAARDLRDAVGQREILRGERLAGVAAAEHDGDARAIGVAQRERQHGRGPAVALERDVARLARDRGALARERAPGEAAVGAQVPALHPAGPAARAGRDHEPPVGLAHGDRRPVAGEALGRGAADRIEHAVQVERDARQQAGGRAHAIGDRGPSPQRGAMRRVELGGGRGADPLEHAPAAPSTASAASSGAPATCVPSSTNARCRAPTSETKLRPPWMQPATSRSSTSDENGARCGSRSDRSSASSACSQPARTRENGTPSGASTSWAASEQRSSRDARNSARSASPGGSAWAVSSTTAPA